VRELTIPANLASAAEREGRHRWLDRLPATISDLSRRWKLQVGEPFQPGGVTAWVAPAVTTAGQHLVIKLVWPHPEAAHEAEALRLWAGRGAVLLHAAEDLGHTLALLVERCNPGVPLSGLPEPDQDHVIAQLLGQLWLEPPAKHPFRPLEEMCNQWAAEFETNTAGRTPPVDPGLVRTAMELFRHLPTTSPRTVVVSTDLHAGNVLAAEREPWLAIDPKPYVGDPTYDVLQHMLNCPSRLKSDPINLINRVADLAGLEPQRTRLWLFARCVQESPDWADLAEVARLITPP
jgi:streptomycin 6-kinase